MLKYGPETLDYFSLHALSQNLEKGIHQRKVRFAILADCAPQQLATLLKTVLHLNDIEAEIYEADFDSIELEVFNPESGLYKFKPDAVFIMNTVQTLRHKYYSDSKNRPAFAGDCAGRMQNIWKTLADGCDAQIIQSNFVLPLERFFGNYDTAIEGSLVQVVREINHELAAATSSFKNVFINDVESLASYHGRKHFFDEKLWVFGKIPAALDYLPLIIQNTADIFLTATGSGVKCVVCDLDNTLWGGVIGDDGLDGIALGHLGEGEAFLNLQSFLLELKKRGIILAVCSKNDESNALLPFREHPEMILKEDDMAVFVANWNNKADNIRHIQKVLNIGFDSMVFLDDTPFERNLVREMLPDVIVPEMPEDPAEYVKYINELNLFETTTFTAEDKNRAGMYRAQAQRKELETSFGGIEDYLKSLEMKIHVSVFDEFNLPRIAQLSQRSNQFNLTTSRINEAQCESFMKDEKGYLPLYIKLKDRFGDYGLISVVVLRLEESVVHVDEWLMSCRVLSRGVEQYVMNYIFEFAAKKGLKEVQGHYKPTAKNNMVREFYKQFDFSISQENGEQGTVWLKDVDSYRPQKFFLEPENY